MQCDLQETELHIIGVDLYGVAVIGSLQRELGRFAVDRIQAVFGEFQFRRFDNVQRFCAQHAAVCCNKLNLHITERLCCKYIARQRAEAFIGHLQRRAIGECNRTAGRSDAGCFDGQLGSDSHIVIVRRNDCMVEYIGGLCGRNDNKRGADRAFITIRRTVHNRDRFRAFALGSKGRGPAAVQIHCGNTTGILHDLCDLDGTAARGERLLPSVEHHQHDLTVISNTNAGTGSTPCVIIAGCIHDDLAVPDEPHGTTNSLLNLALVCIPLGTSTDNGRSVLENAEEVFAGDTVILNALHNQGTGRRAVAHVVEVGIDTDDSAVVGNIMFRVVRVGMLFLGSIHLIRQASHLPCGAVIVIIVGIDIDIAACDIRSCEIINNLFIILRQRHFHFLLNAGSQYGGGAGKDLVIIVFQLSLCRFVEIIGKSIAAGTAQIGIDTIRKVTAFQRADALVSVIGIIDGSANVILR